MKLQANNGECVYNFLCRAAEEVQKSSWNRIEATHDNVTILVYKDSCIEDLCDKFGMQIKINQLKGETS